jgi:hypothetical protein
MARTHTSHLQRSIQHLSACYFQTRWWMSDISCMVSHTNMNILIFVLSPALVAFTVNEEIKCSVLVKFYYVYKVYLPHHQC